MMANRRFWYYCFFILLANSLVLKGQNVSTVQVSERNSYKRGSNLEMNWVGGTPTDKLNVELLRDTVVQQRIAENLVNTQKFSWLIPMNIKPGNNYVVRVTRADSPEVISMTQPFIIRRKIPLLLKVLPIVALGTTAIIVSGSKGSESNDLPMPVKPN